MTSVLTPAQAATIARASNKPEYYMITVTNFDDTIRVRYDLFNGSCVTVTLNTDGVLVPAQMETARLRPSSSERAATITVLEMSSPCYDFDTENGIGHADNVEPYEVDVITVKNTDDAIHEALNDLGLGEWDGGNTGYDPNGSIVGTDGTITTRWAQIDR